MKVMSSSTYHIPVLLHECISNLNIKPDGVYVDLTFGGGGHSKAILEKLGPNGKLFAFDQDEDAAKNALNDPRFTLIPQNFRFIKNYLRLHQVKLVDGILGDLGVSSHQFDSAERGFSIRFNSKLDMRMNKKSALNAFEVVNNYSEEKLIAVLKEYGEITNSKKVAYLIAQARTAKAIETTEELKEITRSCAPRFEEHKFYAKLFQAIRIEVNQEMEALKECLNDCVTLLTEGGRLVIISYHSLEDRLVKNLIKTGNTEGIEVKDVIYGSVKKIFKNLSGKPIVPSEEEQEKNTRSRSAKLRVAEKI
jgi:16S rRNA (cytosine1402-N4)-methyltransferase